MRAAVQISQQTFDDAVRENVEEFGMALAEAVRDAVQQFEAQGVDLSNILKLGGGVDGGDDDSSDADSQPTQVLEQLQHAITELRTLASGLAAAGDNSSADVVVAQLTQLQELCGRFPEAKVVAGRHDAVDTLLDVVVGASVALTDIATTPLGTAQHGAALEQASALLTLLCADCADNQDFVGQEGMQRLAETLERLGRCSTTDTDASSSLPPSAAVSLTTASQLVRVLQAVRAACAKHEANKAHFAKAQGVEAVSALLPAARQSDALSKHVALVLRALTVNDDPSATFSQAQDAVKALVAKDVIAYIVEEVQSRAAAPEMLALWLVVLKQLAITEENCKKILELRGLELLQQVMIQHERHLAVTKRCITVLRNVAAADELKEVILKSGGVERVLAGMQLHRSDPSLQQHACATLAAVALRAPQNSVRIVELGGAREIALAMRTHRAHTGVLRQASLAIRNLVARSAELRPRILDEDVEPLLRDAQRFRGCGDEAYAALRDLGCDIQLAAFGTAAAAKARFNPVNVESTKLLDRVEEAAEAPFAS